MRLRGRHAVAALVLFVGWAVSCTRTGDFLCRGPLCLPDDGGSGGSAGGSGGDLSTASSTSTMGTGGAGGAISPGQWIPADGLESCEGETLDLSKASWPARIWSSCGTGCLRSAPLEVPGETVTTVPRLVAAAGLHAREGYLSTAVIVDGLKFPTYQVIERIDDGQVLFVLRHDHYCEMTPTKAGAPLLTETNPVPGNTHWVGTIDPSTGQLTAASPFETSSQPVQWFTFDGGWGVLDGYAAVRLALDPTTPQLNTVSPSPGGAVWLARARGDMVVWIDDGTSAVSHLRRWTSSTGEALLFEGAYHIDSFALSDEHLVWFGGDGPQVNIGIYEQAQLFYSPLTADPAQVVENAGPDVTGKVQGTLPLVAGSGYAAFTSSAAEGPLVFVWELATGKTWTIPMPAEASLVVHAITSTDIVLTETQAGNLAGTFQNWYRFALAELDALEQNGYGP